MGREQLQCSVAYLWLYRRHQRDILLNLTHGVVHLFTSKNIHRTLVSKNRMITHFVAHFAWNTSVLGRYLPNLPTFHPETSIQLCYMSHIEHDWWKEKNPAPLGMLKPCRQWEKLPIRYGISAINNIIFQVLWKHIRTSPTPNHWIVWHSLTQKSCTFSAGQGLSVMRNTGRALPQRQSRKILGRFEFF